MQDAPLTPETPEYEPPRLEVLGTLADLTLGGGGNDPDGMFDTFENSAGPI